MNSQSISIKCSIVRGGTSKALFIMENELPKDPVLREKMILALYGSPDIRQIDGLGGADLLTSKLAIIGPSTHPNADVDYTFGQVSITEPFVEFNSNCGNISSGVGPFAIDNGLVEAVEPITTVRIHLKNLGKIMVAKVPVIEGKASVDGDFEIDGVPGTGARISMDWSDVIGGTTGKLLPTGNAKDVVQYDGKEYHVSIVDAGTISVFVPANELGIRGTESPQEIEADEELMELMEAIRGKACERIGLVDNWEDAMKETPYLPFLVTVTEPTDYLCFTGKQMYAKDVDIVARLSSMGIINKTFAGSGTVSTGAAARIVGSVVYDFLNDESKERSLLHIGHAAGRIPVEVEAEEKDDSFLMKKINIYRTARILMEGYANVRKSSL